MNNRDSLNPQRSHAQSASASVNNTPTEEGIKINGYEQVIEMLRFADPAFRESLLKRINQRDPQLATNLRRMFRVER